LAVINHLLSISERASRPGWRSEKVLMAVNYGAAGPAFRPEALEPGGLKMSTMKLCVAGLASVMILAAPSVAGSLADQFASCASKFASSSKAASVMLECTAADGKLTDCKVTDATPPGGGFDKAALCVAEVLPVGSRTGSVKVPIKFEPSK
jgi:hypothetical protein